MSELKPCPCCGGEAFLEESSRGFRVVCNSGSSCDIAQQNSSWTKKAAIGIWNSRPSPWVSVEDRLPDELQEVLSFASHNGIAHSIYRAKTFKKANVVWEHQQVTHWMPLPQPPKEQG